MDADCIENQRDQLLSRREKRWSMNSQRLEEIVAELLKPIKDARQSFDTDFSALLEEYLTEAGLRALDAGEDSSAAEAVAINFSEVAMLLQHSVSIYGQKVDCLYEQALAVNDSLIQCTQEAAAARQAGAEGAATPAGRRRRRGSGAPVPEFEHIVVARGAHAQREPAAPGPPPTMPRTYIGLEPRVITDADVPLFDYSGEPIGLLGDFQVTWRLHRGMLVHELENYTTNEAALRPISLLELQAAIEAAAPPMQAGIPLADESPPQSPLRTSTPLPNSEAPAGLEATLSPLPLVPLPLARRLRKRRREDNIADIIEGTLKIVIEDEMQYKLSIVQDFSIPSTWIKKVVQLRSSRILSERQRLRELDADTGAGFAGWESERAADSDDDGFFEQSSVGSSDASRQWGQGGQGGQWGEWQAGVLQRAAASRARAPDVRSLGARVRGALQQQQQHRAAWPELARACAAEPSHVLLASLFLANAAEVEVLPGEDLTVNSFSLRLLPPPDDPPDSIEPH